MLPRTDVPIALVRTNREQVGSPRPPQANQLQGGAPRPAARPPAWPAGRPSERVQPCRRSLARARSGRDSNQCSTCLRRQGLVPGPPMARPARWARARPNARAAARGNDNERTPGGGGGGGILSKILSQARGIAKDKRGKPCRKSLATARGFCFFKEDAHGVRSGPRPARAARTSVPPESVWGVVSGVRAALARAAWAQRPERWSQGPPRAGPPRDLQRGPRRPGGTRRPPAKKGWRFAI
jgi:hypothetical protein